MVCSCVAVAGLGATTSQGTGILRPGSTVAVVGCGPLGLSAVQGARISGASAIIAIDPIRARRELALKVGATHVLDPNVEGDALVAKVRELTKGPNDRLWAGGRDAGGLLGGAGADFVVEAVGADAAPPRAERGPDPTGILPLRQAYEMCAAGGDIVTTSLPRGNITLAGGAVHDRRPHASRRPGRRLQPDARHPALRRHARQRAVRRQGAGHDGGADRAHARGLRRGRVPDDGHGHHDGVSAARRR